jgi:hypothetical protein
MYLIALVTYIYYPVLPLHYAENKNYGSEYRFQVVIMFVSFRFIQNICKTVPDLYEY